MHPPGSFQALFPETGQAKPFIGSFNAVCMASLQLIRGNPFLASKHHWPTDMAGVERLVEEQNVARCLAGGWTGWLLSEDGPPPAPQSEYSFAQKKSLRNVADNAKNIVAGIGILLDWIGPTTQAVPEELAERRAATCVACPLNGKGGIIDYFTSEAAKKIQTQLQMRTAMSLKTSLDKQLGTCLACTCWLPLKLHVPIEFIFKHTSDEVKAKFDPKCWVLAESKQI